MYRIYWLSPDVKEEEKLRYTKAMKLRTRACPVSSSHSMRQRWSRPLKAIAPWVAMSDIEWTVYRDIIVNTNVAASLQEMQFTGVEFSSAELFTTTETPIGRCAFELRVTGWGGVAPVESGVRVVDQCGYCKRQVFSEMTDPKRLFSVEAWDGADFFIIWPLPRFVMITE